MGRTKKGEVIETRRRNEGMPRPSQLFLFFFFLVITPHMCVRDERVGDDVMRTRGRGLDAAVGEGQTVAGLLQSLESQEGADSPEGGAEEAKSGSSSRGTGKIGGIPNVGRESRGE